MDLSDVAVFVRLLILKLCEHLFVCMWWTEKEEERVRVRLILSFMFLLRQKQAVKNKKSLITWVKGFWLRPGQAHLQFLLCEVLTKQFFSILRTKNSFSNNSRLNGLDATHITESLWARDSAWNQPISIDNHYRQTSFYMLTAGQAIWQYSFT